MPSPFDEKVAAYNALSDLNALALNAFTAQYPLITVGATFTETIGTKWKVRYIYADRNQAMFCATFVDNTGMSDVDTNYTRTFFSPEPEMLWFNGNFTDTLTTQLSGQVINIAIARFGEVIDIDIDGLTDNVEQCFHELTALPEMYALWRSPSGSGLKGLIRVPDDLIHCDSDYKKAFMQIKQHILQSGYTIDRSCSDVRRLCFICSDPAIYINENATPFNFDPEIWNAEPQKPHIVSNTIASHDQEQTLINRCTVMILNAPHGTIHNSRVKAGRLAGGFIAAGRVDEHAIISALERASAFVGSQYGDNQAALEIGYKAIFDGIQYGKAQPIQQVEYQYQQPQQYKQVSNGQAQPIVSNVIQFQQPSGITPFSDLSP